MKRFTMLGITLLVAGGGVGPKHLPKSDYQHGKAAFEMLENFDQATSGPDINLEKSGSFLLASAQQMDAVDAKRSSGLESALTGYRDAIAARVSAGQSLHSAELSVEIAETNKESDTEIRDLLEKRYAASRAGYDIAPIIKLCHDDAAQYFDQAAPGTNDCDKALAGFKAEYHIK